MPDPVKKKIKLDPSGETKWSTKGGTYVTTGEANIWFQLTKFATSRMLLQTQVQSGPQCQECILQHHPWMQCNERTPI